MAVYTYLSTEDIEQLLEAYTLGKLTHYHGIAAGVENSNYMVQTTSGRYILTLYEKRVRIEDLPFYLHVMESLAKEQVPCPVPVKNKHQQAISFIGGKPCALTTFLQGSAVTQIKNHHIQALAKHLARMHVAGKKITMTKKNAFSVEQWRALYHRMNAQLDSYKKGLNQEIDNQLIVLEKTWPENLPVGVIHADLFPDNVFFRENSLTGIIDFYFSCTDSFMYDLAICLNAWCFEKDHSLNITKAQLLLKTYHKVRPVTEEELTALPVLASGAAMRFLLTRLYDWLHHHHTPHAMVSPHDPMEFLKKLRFHYNMPSYHGYGIQW